MSRDIINIMILSGYFLSLFGITELLHKHYRWKVELTRKIVHAGTGLLVLLFPIMLNHLWSVLLLCSAFALLLSISLRTGYLNSINGIHRKSYGSLLYPLSVFICYAFFSLFNLSYVFFSLPVLILALCDPIAALSGKKLGWLPYSLDTETKTVAGNIGFFVTAFLISTLLIFHFFDAGPYHTMTAALLISIFSTLAEGISTDGKDNLSVPATALIALFICDQFIL